MRTVSLKNLSRASRNIDLIPVQKGIWKFHAGSPDEWIMNYLRVCYNDDESINFIDPSDGPLIQVGEKYNGLKIDKINIDDGKILIYAEDEQEI